jgi:hypothetical protein
MSLFKKNDQKVHRVITCKCPHCGKEYNVSYFKVKSYYLDGTPKELEGVLSQIVICDCGCVCQEGMTTWSGLSQIITSAAYQSVLHSDCNTMEKKLRLMTFFPLSFVLPEVWLTHLVPESQLPHALQRAIQRIQQLPQEFPPLAFGQIIKGCYMPEFQWKYEFFVNENLLLSDLYRRSKQFANATMLLDAEAKNTQDTYVHDYINFQRQLIANNDSQYQ